MVLAGRDPPVAIGLSMRTTPTVATREDVICEKMALCSERQRLRLIVDGRLVHNDTQSAIVDDWNASCLTLGCCGIHTGSAIHCGVSERPNLPIQRQSRSCLPITFVAEMEDSRGEVDFECHDAVPQQLQSGSNFELATTDDIQPSEIALLANDERDDTTTALREVIVRDHSSSDFNAISPSYVFRAPPAEFGQDAGPSLEDQDETLGGWADLFNGALLGCGLGLIMLLLTFDKTIVFSKRFQDGIRLGVICNIGFGLTLLVWDGEHVPLF